MKKIAMNYQLYLLLLPTLIYFIIFKYGPMYGVQIAFKNFKASLGIVGSPWVGFENFTRFFHSFQFSIIIKNTIEISLYQLLVAFPIPIVLALLLNQLQSQRFKRWVQTITYAPHFISTVVIVGMIHLFLSPKYGIFNTLLHYFGIEPVFFMGQAEWFKTVFVFSGIWQNMGWSMIIYLAALTSINPDLHEAAVVDGASKIQRIRNIDIPGIMPTIIILLILDIGNFMTIGFEKVYLMQNSLNIDASEIIQTYVYKTGILGAQFSYSSAIGLFNSAVNCILLVTVNYIAKRMKQTSLW